MFNINLVTWLSIDPYYYYIINYFFKKIDEDEIKSDSKSLERFMNIRQQLVFYLGEDNLPANLLSIYGKVSVFIN